MIYGLRVHMLNRYEFLILVIKVFIHNWLMSVFHLWF